MSLTIDTVYNPTGTDVNITVRIQGNLGSDASTYVWANETYWIGTDDYDSGGDPSLAHVFGRQGNASVTGDNPTITYTLYIPAGESRSVVTFAIKTESQTHTREIAEDIGKIFEKSLSEYSAYMGIEEISRVENWKLLVCSATIPPAGTNTTAYYYINVTDLSGNTNTSSIYSYTTGIDTTPPASITNLTNTTGQTWINWTWANPADADFNYTMVYLDGKWKINTSNPYYNATGLKPDTYYEIGTHTADKAGNVNETWVNQTAKTILPTNVTATIFINPPYKEVRPNETFYLNVSVNSTSLISAGSVQIEFNASAFTVNDITPGDLWTGTPSEAAKTIDNVTGIIKYDLFTMPGTPLKPSGNFAVINITVKEIAAEMNYTINITDAILSDEDYVEIPSVVTEDGVVGVKPRLPGDVDGDCDVDFHDLLALLRAYDTHCGEPSYNPYADFDHDCDVDFHDLLILLQHYEETCEGVKTAPAAFTQVAKT